MAHKSLIIIHHALVMLVIFSCQKAQKKMSALSTDSHPIEQIQVPEAPTERTYELTNPEALAAPAPVVEQAEARTPWQIRVLSDIEAFKKESEKDYQALLHLKPRVTRSRALRFIDGRLYHPRATSVLLYRLINEEADAQVREALVEAISHSKGEYADAMLDLITREPEPRVRARMVAALRFADEPSTLQGLQLGLKDDSAVVRAAVARTIGKLDKTPQLVNLLMTNLKDKDPAVQIAAIQSARIFKLTEAKDTLETLLGSTHPTVRLESLYAISHLAPEVLERVPKLEQDPDQKVSEAAVRLRHKAGFRGPPRLK
jgi:hypothetical protein